MEFSWMSNHHYSTRIRRKYRFTMWNAIDRSPRRGRCTIECCGILREQNIFQQRSHGINLIRNLQKSFIDMLKFISLTNIPVIYSIFEKEYIWKKP
mmetsp:Transcript_1625/g.1683  ORF Transcript_1625/g.1683 Transcript_1625/m.1683 type:complete len:96 (+) Transcript_1625:77-364(+)